MSREDNVRHALSLDFFHMLERGDLEAELRRLDEKLQRYLLCMNETTERVTQRMQQIHTFLQLEIPDGTSTCSATPVTADETSRRTHMGT